MLQSAPSISKALARAVPMHHALCTVRAHHRRRRLPARLPARPPARPPACSISELHLRRNGRVPGLKLLLPTVQG